MKTIIEPFRIKSVEPIGLSTPEQRSTWIREAGYNPFRLRAEQVLIDLLTDSGNSAMSARQWGAVMEADESYAGARSFYRFEAAVRDLFGHAHVIPTHQGRAAERLLCGAVLRRGDVVPGNIHFDTTRANIEASGAEPRDLPVPEARDPDSPFRFKGNVDLDALERTFAEVGRERIPFVLVTVTNNSGGGQPASMENLEGVRAICDRNACPLFLDVARFAENAWFVKSFEPAWADRTPREIARAMFALSDGALMSMKKDAFGNMGGVLSLNDDAWAERIRQMLILTEGFPTYGGLAGRDLEALAVGLEEVLDEDYLRYRIASTRYVGERLAAAGVPVFQPIGGHAVYLDGRRFCPHLDDEDLPAWSLGVALYEHAGIRSCEVGNVVWGRPRSAGGWTWPALDLLRLAIPRRVYTQSHMDYVVEAISELHGDRERIAGLCWVERPEVLPHFTSRFRRLELAAAR